MNIQSLSATIDLIAADAKHLLPILVLVMGAIAVLITQLIVKDKRPRLKAAIGLVFLALTACALSTGVNGVFFNESIHITDSIRLMQYVILMVAGLVLYFPKGERLQQHGEYHFLIFSVLIGAFVVMQVQNLLLFYLGVELISISSYVLVTFDFKSKSFEAGIKYLLFGAVSSALMLYGISLLYGMAGSLQIDALQALIQNTSSSPLAAWMPVATGLFMVGLLFKLAVVPMHIWSPDVYEAAPTPVVAFISIVPKIAILLFFVSFIELSGLAEAAFNWKKALAILAMASMFVGNLSALAQTNAKRMMAYSSIAHAGVLLIGVIVGTDFGVQALLFYMMVYAVLNVSAFYIISIFESNGSVQMNTWSGLGRKFPWIGVAVLVVMIGLVGLPPTGGFTAKLLLFSALWEYYSTSGDTIMLWLFVVGLINTAIALFYYLRIPYYLFVKPLTKENEEVESQYSVKDVVVLVVLAFVILMVFFKGDWLIGVV